MPKYLSRLYKRQLPDGRFLIGFDAGDTADALGVAMPFDVTGPEPIKAPAEPMTDSEAQAWIDAHCELPWTVGIPERRPIDLPHVEQLESLEDVLTQNSVRWNLAWEGNDGHVLVVAVENRSPHTITRLGCCFAYELESPQPQTEAAGMSVRLAGEARYCFHPQQSLAEPNQVCRFHANGMAVDAMRNYAAMLSVERYRIRIETAGEPFAEIPGAAIGAHLEA